MVSTKTVDKDIEQVRRLYILNPENRFILASSDRIKVDIIFPVLHGTMVKMVQGLIKDLTFPWWALFLALHLHE
jgi:hypothetical protein